MSTAESSFSTKFPLASPTPRASYPMDAAGHPLTTPAEPRGNQGWDNEHNDLIVYTHDVLFNEITNASYLAVDKLGQGTFGQVLRCWSHVHRSFVAVKIIKNQAAYHQQAMVEVKILQSLNRDYNAERHNFVRLLDYFRFRNHLCLVFELLQRNLFELIKVSGYQGFSLSLVKHFIKQVLQTLMVLRQEHIIHGDLKPENVLMEDERRGLVKVIDFGSSCMEHETVYSYIQSRFYRSPEVVLSYPYDSAIDVWSLGCIAAELYLGLPLFPAASERDLLARMIEILGPFPASMLEASRRVHRYFRNIPHRRVAANGDVHYEDVYHLLSEEEFQEQNHEAAPTARRYFEHSSLRDIIQEFKPRSGTRPPEDTRCFLDFLLGLLKVDPQKRWNAEQAAAHPFITGTPFHEPFHPPPAAPRTASRPVGIGIMPDARYTSASWHPNAHAYSNDAHSIAHEAAMFAVSQLTNSVASNSSHLATGPGSFVQVMGSVPGVNGMTGTSSETNPNPIMMAAMRAAREAFSNPSCPSTMQTTSQTAASPGYRRIHGFHVVQAPQSSTEAPIPFSQGPSFNGSRPTRPMADIKENGPPDDGREPSFDLDSNLSLALESCHLQPPNCTSSEQTNNNVAASTDDSLQFQTGRAVIQPPSYGIGGVTYPPLFTSGPSQRDHASSAWQMPIPSQLHGVSAGSSSHISAPNRTQGMSNPSGCISSGGFSGQRDLLERPLIAKDSEHPLPLDQGSSFNDGKSYETGFDANGSMPEIGQSQVQLTTEPPLRTEGDIAGSHSNEPMSPENLFPEEFLDGE